MITMSKTIGSISDEIHSELKDLVQLKCEREKRRNVTMGEIISDLLNTYKKVTK